MRLVVSILSRQSEEKKAGRHLRHVSEKGSALSVASASEFDAAASTQSRARDLNWQVDLETQAGRRQRLLTIKEKIYKRGCGGRQAQSAQEMSDFQ